MSMMQIAFIRKADIPSNRQIQDTIQKLGYDFKILNGIEKQIDQDGLECSINGYTTYFETYVGIADKVITENAAEWIKTDLTNQDTAISFVWGADHAAGACIGLISIALIDKGQALVYYLDDEMKYSREMLVADTPQFLNELEKQEKTKTTQTTEQKVVVNKNSKKKSFWDKLKDIVK